MALQAPVDPDMFWHLKNGELMVQYQTFPHADWYSYTMSDYPYVDFEWLTEVLMFFIWKMSGYGGLSVIFALIITTTFGVLLPKSIIKAPYYLTYFLAFSGAYISAHTFGARPQVLSHFDVALLLYLIAKYNQNDQSKIVWSLPIIFLLWANLHGGFVIGIGFMIIYILLEKFLITQNKRFPGGEWLKLYNPLSPEAWKKLACSFALSLPLTFLNPYGWRMYYEAYKAITDTYDKSYIMEWLSPNFHNTEGFIFGFYVIFIFIALMIFKKIDLFSFVLIPLALFFAFQALRNIPFFTLIAVPFLANSMSDLENIFFDLMNKKFIAISTAILLIFFLPITNKTAAAVKTFNDPQAQAEKGEFPAEALNFLLNHPEYHNKNIYNFYAWGGYILHNAKCSSFASPSQSASDDQGKASEDKQMTNDNKIQCGPKVFIDGRMSYWILDDRQILKDYIEIENIHDGWEKLIDQYNIQIIFLNKKTVLARSLKFNNKWEKKYEDDIAIIYEKR
jgi:hypothetical protein